MLEKIIDYYGENYELSRNCNIFGEDVSCFAKRSSRAEQTVLGFKIGQTPAYGPEASEYVFILERDAVTIGVLKQIEALLSAARSAYVKPGPDHAFTFISAIVLAGKIKDDAAASIKKIKLRKNYGQNGFDSVRITILTADGGSFSNSDGKDLKNLLLRLIK